MNPNRIRVLIFLTFFVAFLLPNFVLAQDVQYDQFQGLTLLPRLSGAVTIEAGLEPRIQLTRKTDALPGIGFGMGGGYSFCLDPHGKRRFRLVVDTSFSGTGDSFLFGLGATATFSVRRYSPHFVFGSVGLSATAKFLNHGTSATSTSGVEAGVGLELAIGSLFYDQPYLFGEFSNSVFLTYNNVNGSIAIFGRIGLRFDWAIRDRSVQDYIWE